MDVTGLVIPNLTDPGTLACIARARGFKQYCDMVHQALLGECSFCKLDPEKNAVIVESTHWQSWQNPYPEKHTKHHFIIAPRKHLKALREMAIEVRAEVFGVMDELQDKHGYVSDGVLIRNGDARLSAGTIEHLHIHVMVPDGTGRVESPFYKGDKAESEGLARAIIYEKLRLGTPTEQLSEEEWELVKDRF